MTWKVTLPAIGLLVSGLVLTGQPPATPVTFTAAQAEAGRTALPPVASLRPLIRSSLESRSRSPSGGENLSRPLGSEDRG